MPDISNLKREHPSWNWIAMRHGFGSWRYIGTKGNRRVEVSSVGELGEFADVTPAWRAYEGDRGESYAYWSMFNKED